MTIQTDFEARFPNIPWTDPPASTWTSYTCLEYNDKNQEAILNLIAHLITLSMLPGTGAARTAESKAVGSVSVSYGSSKGGATDDLKSFFNSTRYGQAYWLLAGGRRVGARFV